MLYNLNMKIKAVRETTPKCCKTFYNAIRPAYILGCSSTTRKF